MSFSRRVSVIAGVACVLFCFGYIAPGQFATPPVAPTGTTVATSVDGGNPVWTSPGALITGTAGQFLIENDAGSAASFVSPSGDLSCSTTNPGNCLVATMSPGGTTVLTANSTGTLFANVGLPSTPTGAVAVYGSGGALNVRGSGGGGVLTQLGAAGIGTHNSQAITDTIGESFQLRTVSSGVATTIAGVGTPSNFMGHILALVACRAVTAPASGSIGDAWAGTRSITWKNISGTASIVGSVSAIDTQNDTSMSATAFSATVSTNTVLLQIANVSTATVDCSLLLEQLEN